MNSWVRVDGMHEFEDVEDIDDALLSTFLTLPYKVHHSRVDSSSDDVHLGFTAWITDEPDVGIRNFVCHSRLPSHGSIGRGSTILSKSGVGLGVGVGDGATCT